MSAADGNMTRVSIFVPSYNHARFLEQRLSSIQFQTFPETELIILDDASTDGSPAILKRYEGMPHTRVILNDHNSGCVFRQWNLGVREARGEYVWIAESDDYADLSFLTRMVACLDTHPNVGLAYCQSRIIDEHNHDRGVNTEFYKYLDAQRWRTDFVNDGRQECARFHIFRNTIPNASAVLFRRSTYRDAGWADERMRLAGDWLQWAKMMMISDVAFVADALNYYRIHSGTVRSATLDSPRSLREFLAITAYIRRHVQIPESVRQTVNEQWVAMWGELSNAGARVGINDNILLLIQAMRTDPLLVRERMKAVFRPLWTKKK